MRNRFNMSESAMKDAIANLDKNKEIKDGVAVVSVICSGCGNWYEEEIETAKAVVVTGSRFLCIRCDSGANESSGVKLTQIGLNMLLNWFK